MERPRPTDGIVDDAERKAKRRCVKRGFLRSLSDKSCSVKIENSSLFDSKTYPVVELVLFVSRSYLVHGLSENIFIALHFRLRQLRTCLNDSIWICTMSHYYYCQRMPGRKIFFVTVRKYVAICE